MSELDTQWLLKVVEEADEIALGLVTRDEVIRALDDLTPRLRRVLIMRFGLLDDRPHTLEEVGRELGVTRERIRQLEREALQKLRLSDRLPTLSESPNGPDGPDGCGLCRGGDAAQNRP